MILRFSKVVEKLEEKVSKTSLLASKMEKLGKLSVDEMKKDHRLFSTLVAKPFPDHSHSRQP